MKRISIKLRVTLWFTLLMLVLGGLALGLLFYGGAQSGLAARRELLTTMVEDSEKQIDLDGTALEIDRDLEAFRDGVYLSVYDSSGVPLYGMVPRAFDNSTPFGDRQLRTIKGEETDWYLYDQRFEIEGWGEYWVRGVCEAAAVDSTISRLLQLAAMVLPFYLLLAALSGYLLTSGALRPVRRIIRTAQQISAGNDLSRRINLGQGRDEIYTLAAEFDRMFSRLEAAFENEKQFTSDASHELRTPVAVILSQCEYALAKPETTGQAREALETVQQQARRMATLIGQLLTLTRADSAHRRLMTETVDLSGLAQAVAEQTEELAAKKQIRVTAEIQPGLTLQGDETMLLRMLVNLTENAVRYGRTGGNLSLTLRRDGDQIEGCVSDDGIGIPADQQPLVWNRFWQADPSKGSGGAGLGLSMVKWIAEAHGGSVRLESTPGQGSSFYFTLPVSGPASD